MRRVGWVLVLLVLAAVAWWAIGFLPWIASGLTWATYDGGPVGSSVEGLSKVRLPVPLAALWLSFLVSASLVGGTAAGVAPILFPRLHRGIGVFAAWFATAVTVPVVLWRTASKIHREAPAEFASDERVLLGLGIIVVLATGAAMVLGSIASNWHSFASVPAALVAGAMPTWVHAFGGASVVDVLGRVALVVVLVAGLAASTHRTLKAVLLWPVAFAIAFLAAPAFTALAYLAGLLRPSAGLPGSLPELVGSSRQVFGEAVRQRNDTWTPLVVALALGLLWLVAEAVRRRAGSVSPDDLSRAEPPPTA